MIQLLHKWGTFMNKTTFTGSAVQNAIKSKITKITFVLLGLIVISSLASEYFLTFYNIQSVTRDLAFVSIIAIAQSCLLLLGELDLSVGKIAALCGILSGLLMVQYKVPPVLAIVICILLGALFGLLNGLIITGLKLNAMIVTIGMQSVYGGIILVLTRGKAITNIPKGISFLGSGSIAGIPVPFLFMLLILTGIIFLVKFTRFGRYIYAIGNSREAATILGIKTNRVRLGVYALVGMVSAFAGLLMVARLGTAQPSIGDSWPLNGIAAAVIGGVALTGGDGNPLGALIGAMIISIIQNMIVLFGINIYWQTAVSGIVVVLAISIDPLTNLLRNAQKKRARNKELKVR